MSKWFELLKLFEFRNNIIILNKIENGKKIIIFDEDEKLVKFFDIENECMSIIKDKIDCVSIEIYWLFIWKFFSFYQNLYLKKKYIINTNIEF